MSDKVIYQNEERIVTRRKNGTLRIQKLNPEPTMTQQQFIEECDVNNIIKKYKTTGSIAHVRNATEGAYMDLTTFPSLYEAETTIAHARSLFEDMPAAVRNRFDHDPKNLIAFLSDEKNSEEALKLGLRNPTPVIPDPALETLKEINENLKNENTSKRTRAGATPEKKTDRE